jgi:membrane-associated HD superfamily phosphohydrolase
MLADSVEAVTRTLDDPKPGRVQSAIEKVVADKFLSGQLEECNLTLRDLHKIQEAFLTILIGVFHQRIDYPSAADAMDSDSDDAGDSASLGDPQARHATVPTRLSGRQ